MRKLVYTLAAIAALAGTNLAEAAQITVDWKDGPWVLVTGTFTPGDDQQFNAATRSLRNPIVKLDSDGGSADAGLNIARIVHERQLVTVAPFHCSSACAVAWLAGRKRAMSPTSRIGFHGVYDARDGSASGDGNAVLGAFLHESGLSDPAIVYVTKARSNEMTWLTIADARRWHRCRGDIRHRRERGTRAARNSAVASTSGSTSATSIRRLQFAAPAGTPAAADARENLAGVRIRASEK